MLRINLILNEFDPNVNTFFAVYIAFGRNIPINGRRILSTSEEDYFRLALK